MQSSIYARLILGLAIGLAASAALSQPIRFDNLVTDVRNHFEGDPVGEELILGAAKNLFFALATISLVWTMGLQVVRQDIGEAMMELLRFMIATGTLYWLLINASDNVADEGFVRRIIGSFYHMTNNDDSDKSFLSYGDGAMNRAQDVYLKVIGDTSAGDESDRIVVGLIGLMVLISLTLLAAQFLLALIMAWFLGYGGIFLLGFGGSRWTSQIAINYYKHVLALGVAILALSFIGVVSANVFSSVIPTYGERGLMTYPKLGRILAISVLMLVLGLRVPQILYTLVTGSSLGLFAGTAGMVGSAIVAGGGAALASASGRFLAGSDGGSAGGAGASAARANSAMEAVERSAASVSAMSDPFHVAGGSDPFGVPRKSDPLRGANGRSVFSTAVVHSVGEISAAPREKISGEHALSTSITADPAAQARREAQAGGVAPTSTSAPSPGSGARDIGKATDLDVVEAANARQPDYSAEMSAITSARSDQLSHASVGARDQDAVIDTTHHSSQQTADDVNGRAIDRTGSASAQAREADDSVEWHDVDILPEVGVLVTAHTAEAPQSASAAAVKVTPPSVDVGFANEPLVRKAAGMAHYEGGTSDDREIGSGDSASVGDVPIYQTSEGARGVDSPLDGSVLHGTGQADVTHVPSDLVDSPYRSSPADQKTNNLASEGDDNELHKVALPESQNVDVLLPEESDAERENST